MEIFIWICLVLLGFVFGYFLQTTVLVILTIIFIIIGVTMLVKAREIEQLIAMIFCGGFFISSAAMWITWYIANGKTFVQDFFTHYIFR